MYMYVSVMGKNMFDIEFDGFCYIKYPKL